MRDGGAGKSKQAGRWPASSRSPQPGALFVRPPACMRCAPRTPQIHTSSPQPLHPPHRFLGTNGFSTYVPSALSFSSVFSAVDARPLLAPPASRRIISSCRVHDAQCLGEPGSSSGSSSRSGGNGRGSDNTAQPHGNHREVQETTVLKPRSDDWPSSTGTWQCWRNATAASARLHSCSLPALPHLARNLLLLLLPRHPLLRGGHLLLLHILGVVAWRGGGREGGSMDEEEEGRAGQRHEAQQAATRCPAHRRVQPHQRQQPGCPASYGIGSHPADLFTRPLPGAPHHPPPLHPHPCTPTHPCTWR